MNSHMKRCGEVWEGPECWSFCPGGVGVRPPSGTWVCSPRKLSESHTFEIFMEA